MKIELSYGRTIGIPNKCIYRSVQKIGAGSYGAVYEGMDMLSGETVAMKTLVAGRNSTATEIAILKSLPPHPSVVKFRRAFQQSENVVVLVMEYLETDLKKFIRLKRNKHGFIQIKKVVKQILEGVKFLHDNGVVHTDLKPENILMNTSGSQLKICDFSLSLQLEPGTSLWTKSNIGTCWYMAPEILGEEKRYSSAIDMWAVGCIMGELVIREPIYQGYSIEDQLACIDGHMNWIRFRYMLGPSGFDLLQRLLERDPDKRITAQDALHHKWFN